MSQQIVILDLRFAARMWQKVVNFDFYDVARGHCVLIVELHLGVEEGFAASWRLSNRVLVVELHIHDSLHVRTAVQIRETLDHVIERANVDVGQRLERKEIGEVGKAQKAGTLFPQTRPMSVGHAGGWETQVVINLFSVFLFGGNCTVFWVGVVLFASLFNGEFTGDFDSQFREHVVHAILDVLAGFHRRILDCFCYLNAFLKLST